MKQVTGLQALGNITGVLYISSVCHFFMFFLAHHFAFEFCKLQCTWLPNKQRLFKREQYVESWYITV